MTYVILVEIDKLDRPKGLKHLNDIFRRQRVGKAGNVQSVIRDGRVLVGIDIQSGGEGKTCTERREPGGICPLWSLSLSLLFLSFPLARLQPVG